VFRTHKSTGYSKFISSGSKHTSESSPSLAAELVVEALVLTDAGVVACFSTRSRRVFGAGVDVASAADTIAAVAPTNDMQ